MVGTGLAWNRSVGAYGRPAVRRSRIRLGPDPLGNWRVPVEPAILKMKKVAWGKWKPKQVFGTQKIIFLPTHLRTD
jgi:hypothetical protein